jgi:hypothetical protein
VTIATWPIRSILDFIISDMLFLLVSKAKALFN